MEERFPEGGGQAQQKGARYRTQSNPKFSGCEQGIELYEIQEERALSTGNTPGHRWALRHSPELCKQGPAKLRTSPGPGCRFHGSLARRFKLHGRARQDRSEEHTSELQSRLHL